MKANRKPQRDNNLDDIIKDDNFAKEHLGNIPKDKIDGLDIIVIDAINTNPDDDHIEDLAPPCIPDMQYTEWLIEVLRDEGISLPAHVSARLLEVEQNSHSLAPNQYEDGSLTPPNVSKDTFLNKVVMETLQKEFPYYYLKLLYSVTKIVKRHLEKLDQEEEDK